MLKEDDNRQRKENEEALAAAADPDLRESYLSSQRLHVLKLASRILGRYLTESDDEWMIAMMGLNQALDTYDVGKGEFWPYAQVVIRSRLMDYTRSSARHAPEMSVGPDVLAGTDSAEEADPGLRREIASRTAVKDESELRDEIEALTEELGELDISFFDLAECSPRAGKTRSKCAQLIRAIFLPPPLMEAIRRTGQLPVKELSLRTKVSRKIAEKYRKYILASAVILDGDYPGIAEYLRYVKE